MPTTPARFSDAASREALRKMIRDGAIGKFDEADHAHDDPVPHVVWALLEQVEVSERLAAIVREESLDRLNELEAARQDSLRASQDSDGWKQRYYDEANARASQAKLLDASSTQALARLNQQLAGVEKQRDRAESKLRDEMKLAHDLANRFSHASSALELVAKDLGIEHKTAGTSGWANPIWEGVRARKDALAEAEKRAAEAKALLHRIAKYAREDRARTPGVTRLARALDEVDQLLASPPPPVPEAGEVKAPASRWAAHCCAARLIPAFFDTREEAMEYLKAFECAAGEGHIVEHPTPPSAGEASK